MDNFQKTMSSLQKDINRITKHCDDLRKINLLRKHQITQSNLFFKKLLDEKRITNEELKIFFKRKNVVKLRINESER